MSYPLTQGQDKNPNDKGHPIQYDTTKNQWFVV